MLIYTGNSDGAKLDQVKRLGMGIMIATGPGKGTKLNKAWSQVPCALDNGAFQCWRRGFPFMADVFRRNLSACYQTGINLNWIVCPDLVARGMDSLRFSLEWEKRLRGARLALAVQDGMTPQEVGKYSPERSFVCVFIGGTKKWKWDTVSEWVSFAHDRGMQAHLGRCGTMDGLRRAEDRGLDSTDGTNICRNDRWGIVENYKSQLALPQAAAWVFAGSNDRALARAMEDK